MELSAPESYREYQRAVAWMVSLTASLPPLASHRYAQQLLARHQSGELSFEHLVALLGTSVYQILYRSQAVMPLNDAQLRELLDQARRHNARQQISGLLLYSEGLFVQVIEGPETAVRALFARIQLDPRHADVTVVSEGLQPRRCFAEWSMDFGCVGAPEMASALDAITTQCPLPAMSVVNARLQTLLRAFTT